MPMLCIAGTFRVTGTQPDGDSVRFVPHDPAEWRRVGGAHRVRANRAGGAQLRLDGIDALETHYAPRGGKLLHQPLALAHAARDELLQLLGFEGVEHDDETVEVVTDDDQPGYILTRGADEYGRCVAIAGAGPAPAESGSDAYVDVDLLTTTVNHRLIASGLAYPTFYSKLFYDLRDELAEQAATARAEGRGVFAADATQSGVSVESLGTLTDDAVLLPKLFRRLVDYLHLGAGDISLAGLPAYLEQRNDRLYVKSTAQRTGLHAVIEVEGQTFRLTTEPEDLIFDEA